MLIMVDASRNQIEDETKASGSNPDEVWKELWEIELVPHKTLRDPVHGDIEINHLETKIIDTEEFQRLRRLKQLGTSDLIYLGATHTRFSHSLGTLHMAQKMIEAINKNPKANKKVEEPYDRFLIRICALLHDLLTTPFGHTLEDEGNLFTSQWKDANAVKYFFIPDNSDIYEDEDRYQILKVIVDFIDKNNLWMGNGEQVTSGRCVGDIIQTLNSYEKDGRDEPEERPEHMVEIYKLKSPFISDIVGNTLCADLLDYIDRDIYYAGLSEAYDRRFLNYLLVKDVELSDDKPKPRLVLNLFKEKGMRRDVVSEMVHLLRLRYSLGEKIYYHHAKMITSAMLIGAVNSALHEGGHGLSKDEFKELLFEMGDDELLLALKGEDSEIRTEASEHIVGRLFERKMYKPIFRIIYTPENVDDTEARRRRELAGEYRDPETRLRLERELEDGSGLGPGSVIIYDPDPKMALKAARVRLLWRNGRTTHELRKAPERSIQEDVKAIEYKHKQLWKMYVFIDLDLYKNEDGSYTEVTKDVASDCHLRFGVLNDLEELREIRPDPCVRAVNRFAIEYSRDHPENLVTYPEHQLLISSEATPERWTKGGGASSKDELIRRLEDIRSHSPS